MSGSRPNPLHVLLVGSTTASLGLSSDNELQYACTWDADEATEMLRQEDYAVVLLKYAVLGEETLPLLHWARHLQPAPSVVLIHDAKSRPPPELGRHELVFAALTEPVSNEKAQDTIRAAACVARMNRAMSALSMAAHRLDAKTP